MVMGMVTMVMGMVTMVTVIMMTIMSLDRRNEERVVKVVQTNIWLSLISPESELDQMHIYWLGMLPKPSFARIPYREHDLK